MYEKFMREAINLAKKGEGKTKTNPLVGAIIVKNNKIIGRGYHEYYGGNHAEVNAFKSCKEDVRGAEMYVTLEPCSHYGKTPPCANEIVKRGIKKVIVSMIDPNPLVSGRGIKILKENGIEVVIGVLEKETRRLNEVFIKYITKKQPFCTLKFAMTLDGKIASYTGDSKWISNKVSREYVHKLRNKNSAIMVGINTVIKDNPELTTRIKGEKCKDCERVIVDSNAKIPLDAKILNLQSKAKTIIACTEKANKEKLKLLKQKGAEIIIAPEKEGRVDIKYLFYILGERGINSLLIEGGSEINYSVLNEELVDKIIVFIAPKIIGGRKGKTVVGGNGIKLMKNAIELENMTFNSIKDDIMLEAYVKKGGV